MKTRIDTWCGFPRFTVCGRQTPSWKRAPAKGGFELSAYYQESGGTVSFKASETASGGPRDVTKEVMFSIGRDEARVLRDFLTAFVDGGDDAGS